MRVPESLSEALGLLAREPGVWQPFAGGTDLMVLLEAGKLPHKRFLSVAKLDDLRGIEVTAANVTLGALTTYTEIQKHPVLQAEFPLLCAAARETGSVATQNRGTLGGNIVNASPAADSPPALLVYDAEIELVSAARRALAALSRISHSATKRCRLRPMNCCAPSACRAAPNRGGSITGKWARARRRRFPKCALPERRSMENGAIRDIRIALGSVAPIVLRAVKTEDALRGRSITPDVDRRGEGNPRARNRAHRRHSLDRRAIACASRKTCSKNFSRSSQNENHPRDPQQTRRDAGRRQGGDGAHPQRRDHGHRRL